MSRISTYEVVPVPKLADKLIGTSVGGEIEDVTYNFTLQELLNLFIPFIPANNLQGVLDFGNTATQDINLFGTITTTNLDVTNTSNLFITYLNDEVHIVGSLFDSNNLVGTAGQVLTSTGSGVEWYTLPPIFTPNLQQVLTEGNTANVDIILTSDLSALDVSSDTATFSVDITIDGTLTDGTASVGTAGKVLSSTGIGVQWIDLPIYSATSPLFFNPSTGVFSIQVANATQNGYLSSADWITFDGKQGAITLTTTGTSGAATLIGNTLNIPNYGGALSGYVPYTGATQAVNLGAFDLTVNGVKVGIGGGSQITNTLVGRNSLQSNTTGGFNTAIGLSALSTNTIGASNTAIGVNALESNNSSFNTAIGVSSLRFNSSGQQNTAIGVSALYSNTIGQLNTAIGDQALYNNTNGDNNVAVGVGAGSNASPGSTPNTSSQRSIYIGHIALALTASSINEIVIGASAIGNGSNTVTIGDSTITDNYLKGNVRGGAFIKLGGTSTQFLKADGSVDSTVYGIGTVTSVGLSMPSAFNVSNSPINSSGIISVTGAGLASQYIRGDGTLADFPTGGGGGGSSVSYYLNGSVNQGTFVGNTYYEMNKTPIFGAGTDFSIAADGYISQFITDANDPNSLLIPGGNWNLEFYFSASSGGGTPSFYAELYKYDGTTFTLIASNSANPELIAFGTTISPYFSPLAVPETVLLATDRLAIRIYVVTSGRTITLHTENSHLCQIITTFTTGLQSLNGLSKQAQYFAVGTSGTDFAISSSVDTHTFNLPTASATNRGALSSANWTTFNSKQDAITLTTTGSSGAATLIGSTLNIPNYGSALSGYVPYTGATQNVVLGAFDLSLSNLAVNNILANNNGLNDIGSLGGNTFRNVYANSFVKTGGLSSQFLKADGSVDSTAYGTGSVTSVAALTLGTSGTDLSSTVANGNTTPVITLNVPTATATNRGALSSGDWTTFNGKQDTITLTTTGTSGAATFISNTLNIPQYQSVITNPVTGTGTTNYLPKFTASSTIGDSLFYDNGTLTAVGNRVSTNSFVGLVRNFNVLGTDAAVRVARYTDSYATLHPTVELLNYSDDGVYRRFYWDNFVNGDDSFAIRQRLTGGGVTTSGTVIDQTRLMIFSGGNVGINTTTDAGFKLDVNGTGRFSGAVTVNLTAAASAINLINTSTNNIFTTYGNASNNTYIGLVGNNGVVQTNNDFEVYTGASYTKRLTIASTGAATFSGLITSTLGNNTNIFNSASATTGYQFCRMQNTSGAAYWGIEGSTTNQLAIGDVAYSTTFGTLNATDLHLATDQTARVTVFRSTGNVGIGTTTDAGFKLDVNGTGRFNGNLSIAVADPRIFIKKTANSQESDIIFYENNNGHWLLSDSATTNNFVLYNYNTNSNNVSFNYSTGAATFSSDVNSSSGFQGRYSRIFEASASRGGLYPYNLVFGSGTDYSVGLFSEGEIYMASGGSATKRLVMTTGGNVLIGTTTDNGAKLQVAERITVTSATGGNYAGQFTNTHPSAPFGILVYYTNTINDTSNRFIDCEDNTAQRFQVRSNGGVANYQANDVNLSDERTKKEIAPLESYWNKFKAIEIVKFKYKDQTHDDFNIGVIAQQVEKVAPEFIDTDGWGKDKAGEVPMKSVYASDLHHATIKVLQEAMAKIEMLEQKIIQLENN